MQFHFTFSNIKKQYEAALEAGYDIITCKEYVSRKKAGLKNKTIVNRVDIDLSVKKAEMLADIYNELGIKATFFIRLHAPEYNPFSFENYRIIKKIVQTGHEIGYHSEIVDQAAIWDEDAAECLKRDLEVMRSMYGDNIVGVASHGGSTGLNNLDFWKDKTAADFGLLYEGYDRTEAFNLFHESFYVSDSEWIRWKCYNNGVLIPGDNRSFEEHLKDNHQLIYLLIHPDTYFKNHIYE